MLRLNVDGTVEKMKDTSLKAMQEAVGGYIEIIRLPKPCRLFGLHVLVDGFDLMVLDEEGKLKSKPVNEIATMIADNPNDYIVGDVLIAEDWEIV